MKRPFRLLIWAVILASATTGNARAELVSYWPFDDFDGESTPDVVNGYDLNVEYLDADSFFDEDNHIPGKIGNAFEFISEDTTLLSRIHNEGDLLPINQHPEFTISFWTQTEGTGQNDLRLISEASTVDGDPLFNIGTANNGDNGTLDIYLRNAGATANHLRTNSEPFNDEWHHIAWTFQNGTHSIFIDGAFDRSVEFASFAESDPFLLDTTSVGGILRAAPSHWVTGIIDEVAMWNEVLSPVSINGLADESRTPLNALDVLIGDFNSDGSVNTQDYDILVSNFRDAGSYEMGDINGDGTINLVDFGEFLDAAAVVGASVPQSIPEPSSMLLMMGATLFSGLLRKKRNLRR